MSLEDALRGLSDDLTPSSASKKRVSTQLQRRIQTPLTQLQSSLEPSQEMKDRIWSRILTRIDTSVSVAILDRIKDMVSPPEIFQRKFQGVLDARLVHATQMTTSQRAVKFVAALAVVALLVKVGPQVIITPPTTAYSAVTLMPTRGEVSISVAGLWQPVSESITLAPGMMLRTQDNGEASIVFHDDGVVRLAPGTAVEIHDVSDRSDRSTEALTTLTLITGEVWVQGLAPNHLRSIDVGTSYGVVRVHEGSVSIAEDRYVDVSVWDRSAHITQSEQNLFLVAGEKTQLKDSKSLVKKIADSSYETAWVQQNLGRDAVHRRSIAQLQQERRAAQAGILPTSPLYPVKRIAESVDIMLTFGEGARVQKKLEHASARLSEAAALLAAGELESVHIPLQEYRDSLVAVASGSGDTIVLSLIQQSIAEQSGEFAAALPDEDTYLIKKTILEASAAASTDSVSAAEVQGAIVIDTIAALLRKVDEGDTSNVDVIWGDFQQYAEALTDEQSALAPQVRREAQVLLSEFAFAVQENDGLDGEILDEVKTYLPPEEDTTPVLSDEQLEQIVNGIKDRIFVYRMERSRVNQLNVEFAALEGHPDQGRILRRLYHVLPGGPDELPERVRKEIIRLSWEKSAEL